MEALLPNFIIAGVAKTGSTSLYHYVKQHPDVYMCSPKEPDFFLDENYSNRIDSYSQLFQKSIGFKAVGEASISYFQYRETARRIDNVLPEAKIIVVLRDPADRAYSHYNMLVDRGVTPKEPYDHVIEEALKKKSLYKTGIPTSRYYKSLKEYKSVFGNKLRIILYDEFKIRTVETVQCIFNHIEVDSSFVPEVSKKMNVTKIPKYSLVNDLIWNKGKIKKYFKRVVPKKITKYMRSIIRNSNEDSIPPLSDKARRLIINHLMEDIEHTEQLINKDLSHWKK